MVPSKATAQKLSHAQVTKQVTSTASIYCKKRVDDDEKRRTHESHSENSISSNDTSIATPIVQPLPVKSPSIEYSSLFKSLESPRSNANTVTEYHILDSKYPLNSNAKDTSSYCVDKGILIIDNGDTLDSHKNNHSCANTSAITTFTELEVGLLPNIHNPTTLLGSTSSTAYTSSANKIDSLPHPYNKHSSLTFRQNIKTYLTAPESFTSKGGVSITYIVSQHTKMKAMTNTTDSDSTDNNNTPKYFFKS